MSQQVNRPYYEQYSTEITRIHSFDSWPMGMPQKPSILAEAGFFYTGRADRVICYFCGGGIKDWLHDDIPWIEHARWFSTCPYVLLMKGEEYVKKIVNEKLKPPCEIKPSEHCDTVDTIEDEYVNRTEEIKIHCTNLICKICLENELNTCFIPCGHAAACVKCSLSLNNKCPICRRVYLYSIKNYFQ